MICPICGQDHREAKTCPDLGGNQAVCISCCKKCKFQRNPEHFNQGCGWYKAPENVWINIPNEVALLKNKIRTKEEQVRRFYLKNKPWIAERIESEVRYYKGLVAEKEREYERCKKIRNQNSKHKEAKATA